MCIFAPLQVLLLLTMMVGMIKCEPQGPGYLPPGGGGGSGGSPSVISSGSTSGRPSSSNSGHPDDWAGDPVNYEFSYEVQDAQAGLDFGHREMRKDDEATGSYHVLLPDGRTQYVEYIADAGGYRPMIRYEGTATYPDQAPGRSGTAGSASNEGYKYKKK